MKFASTRNPSQQVPFRETVFRGLAPDGGLYVPLEEPDLRDLFARSGRGTSFRDLAAEMASRLLAGDFPPERAAAIAERAFPFSPKVVTYSDRIRILELFHGPTCAFKDFGASFLAAVMEEFLRDEDREAVILTATSGDTGSAVASAFHGRDRISVVILYPSGRVSPLQEKQLTTLGGNVTALEVKGSFDDCQRMVKQAFVDPRLSRELPLTSANSINLGRLIPQSFYYAWGFAQLKDEQPGEIFFSVPSGNFGNLTAGIYAWKWGMPVTGFVAATNANDVVPEYLSSGIFSPRPSLQTYSNAMDVGDPSNFERLAAVFDGDLRAMRSMIRGEVVNDRETLETMRRAQREKGMFLDPHTAVGIVASERILERELHGNGVLLTLATAHPGKFIEVVREATGTDPELPERLARVLELPKQSEAVGNRLEDLSDFLLDRFA